MRRFAIMLILLTACSSEPQGYVAPVIPVRVAEVKVQDVPVYIESVGTVKPYSSVEVKPQVSGRLLKVHFTEGQTVEKGAFLFSIDSESYRNKWKEAKAQLDQDRALLEVMKKKSERYASLTKKELISQQELEDLQAQLIKSEAVVEADEARFASARMDLENCTITAPISGRTGKISTHAGNMVAPTTALVTIATLDPLYVEFALTEKEYQQIAQLKSLSIEVAPLAGAGIRVAGRVTFLDHSFDPKTGLLLLRGEFANSSYLPGQSVKVYLPVHLIKEAKLVPQQAVKINQKGPYVFVIKDHTASIRQVSTGEEMGDQVIILEGLESHETVITEGHLRLDEGMQVKESL